MDNQTINLATARLCGRQAYIHTNGNVYLCDDGDHEPEWDIFADTPQGVWCREQVVKAIRDSKGRFVRG